VPPGTAPDIREKKMQIVRLELPVAEEVAQVMRDARFEVLVAIDDMDGSFKVKIDGGAWSPPMGQNMSATFTPPF